MSTNTPPVPGYLWRKFARFTVQTGDLDPMYDLIYKGRMKLGQNWAEKYALGFFLFYDAGVAAEIADSYDFWGYIIDHYPRFRRGTERRHFRGDKARAAIERMRYMGDPHDIWWRMHGDTFSKVEDHIKNNFFGCQIGPYFIWKAMDLLDRGLGMPVFCSIDEAMMGMPDEPREAAKYFFPDLELGAALKEIIAEIGDNYAPGEPNRKCGVQEAETILCMMKGYFKTQTHKIGDDVDEKHKQLAAYPDLQKFLPPQLIWNTYERAMEPSTVPADSSGVRTEE